MCRSKNQHAMISVDRILDMAEDKSAVESWMMTIAHGIETGAMPRHFITFHDDWLTDLTQQVEDGIEKLGVKMPKDD